MSFFEDEHYNIRWSRVWGVVLACTAAIVLVLTFVIVGVNAIDRYQDRQWRSQNREQALKDAQNKVRVSNIEIQNQEQRIKVAHQRAEIRRERAVGIRQAQDEIAKTLTPLYVQFEMVNALQSIARSGRNNSIVYVPSGANGVPLVSTIDPDKVGEPDNG